MDAPQSISKSLARATACPRYFTFNYLSGAKPAMEPGALASAGTDFHAYRAAYIAHLIAHGMQQDPEWVERYIDSRAIEQDAVDLINRDACYFAIDPERIFATELFLGVDEGFEPTEIEEDATPGRGPMEPDTRYHGTLDLVEVHKRQMTIRDPKTGWMRSPASEYEAIHYAGLAFAHFNYIDEICFEWEFIRAAGSRVPLHFSRVDLDWIHQRMGANYRSMREMIARFSEPGAAEPGIDPAAGLCPICPFTCPARAAVQNGYLDTAPLQTEEDARALVKLVHTASIYAARGRELLLQWIDQHGPINAGPHLVAEVRPETRDQYALSDVLRVLGFTDKELPPGAASPAWDVPLASIKVSATDLKSKAKAKKRSGMMDALASISHKSPHFTLAIGRPQHKSERASANE